MNKTWIIIKREYITRVKKKSFLVTTILIPLLVSGLIALMSYLAVKSEQRQTIVIQDNTNFFVQQFDTNKKSYNVVYNSKKEKESNTLFLERTKGDIYVHIFPFKNNKPDSVLIFKDGGVSLSAESFISNNLDNIYRKNLMKDAGINEIQIDSINNSSIKIKSYDLENNKETSSEISMMLGYGMGFLMYIIIFIYGSGVMRGVMEEKTNRIAEVIVSSVKPFQLMMGKIMGIGLVGLTQFIIWLCLIAFSSVVIPLLFPAVRESMMHGAISNPEMQQQALNMANNEGSLIVSKLMQQNWTLLIFSFLFYFLGGYFIYAAMFAAVGSLVNEDPQEAQQMMLPITMPVIFGMIILTSTIKDPNSSLSVFGSMFPLTSPIVMLARIPYGIPPSQIVISMLLLIVGFILMTGLSAKIYRTGILMYGKKPSWKEILKWIKKS